MIWVAAGMAVASMLAANNQRNAEMKAAAADAKLQRARMKQARTRLAGDYATNTQRMKEAALSREINLEKSRVDAESKMDQQFAGSGISGTSVNELDNDLNAMVAKSKIDNKRSLDESLTDAARSNLQTAEDMKFESRNIGSGPKGLSLGEQVSAGASGYKKGAEFTSGIKKETDGKLDINSMSSISDYLGFKKGG